MIESAILEMTFPLATAGDIAVINLESARKQSWSRFWQSPNHPGVAEYIVEQEQMTLQFLSDAKALDRLDELVERFSRSDAEPMRVTLIRAQVSATKHHFSEARELLQSVGASTSLPPTVDRMLLSIDQACGNALDAVLKIRREMAAKSGRLEDLVPLGALLADLREFDESDRVYQEAFRCYQDVSQFALAWVYFQLGALWGELVTDPQPSRAANWYRLAIDYVPSYVKARVHLSEIYLRDGMIEDAKALLLPALSSADPEVNWRLADVMIAREDFEVGKTYLQTARAGFEALLEKHLLAFADHGAEFYSGSGDNPERASELAATNLSNRATLRAFEQRYEAAVNAGQHQTASDTLTAARLRWGNTRAFGLSLLAEFKA